MPIYEFRCASCSERFEELVRRSDDAVACPECGGAEVERLLSVFAGVGGGSAEAAPDPWRAGPGRMPAGGGCCGGACGHAH